MELIAARQAARQGLHGGEEAQAAPPSAEAACSPTAGGDAEEVTAVAKAAERALQELDAAIARSLELAESSDDPASAQVSRTLS